MTSREEYRQQQGRDTPEQMEPQEPAAFPTGSHLRIHTIIMFALVIWLFLTSFWLYRTIFNKQFAIREASSTAVADQINSAVDSALEQYNLPHSILTKKETNSLVKQAVSDVYDNQRISLDLSPITNQLQSSVSSTLSSYGIDSSLAGNSINAVSTQLNSAVNERVNNDSVKSFTEGLHTASLIDLAVMAVSGILAVVQLVTASFRRYPLKLLAWSGFLAALLLAGTISVGRQVVLEASRTLPDLAASVVGVVKDIANFGWRLAIVTAVISAICLLTHTLLSLRR
ncbi:hypothetical protein [Limosilactobacillus difficilis]|uniref:hypothetical protein n=1 Tax=Limosilactobacillus difficilis TaxID=2991838 RepID=UPI0024B91CAB|nr:hypothetical protein [Limosilactobacillus difficilis]